MNNWFKDLMRGKIFESKKMMRMLPLVFFVVFLGIMIITNRYWSEGKIRQIQAIQDTLKDLKIRTITYETELMKISRPSLVMDKVRRSGLDLIESKEPARRLNVEATKKQ